MRKGWLFFTFFGVGGWDRTSLERDDGIHAVRFFTLKFFSNLFLHKYTFNPQFSQAGAGWWCVGNALPGCSNTYTYDTSFSSFIFVYCIHIFYLTYISLDLSTLHLSRQCVFTFVIWIPE